MNIGGNIRDYSLEHLWHNTAQLSGLRQRTRADLWGYCHDCYYAEVCLAGCTAVSEPVMGRPGNNPFCHHRAIEMDRAGLGASRVRACGPGGRLRDGALPGRARAQGPGATRGRGAGGD